MSAIAHGRRARVIKLRPVCRAPGHLGDEDWRFVLAEWGLELEGLIPRLRYPSNAEWGPFKKWVSSELAEGLDGLSHEDLLVIDACFEEGSELNHALAALRSALSATFSAPEPVYRAPVLVLTGCSSDLADDLFDLVSEGGPLHGSVAAMTLQAEVVGSDPSGVLSDLGNSLRPLIDPQGERVSLRRIQANLVRIRGVFEHAAASDLYHDAASDLYHAAASDLYFGYRYVLEEEGRYTAAALLNRLITESGTEYVLVDTSSSPWMRDVARRLVAPSNLVLTDEDLKESTPFAAEVAQTSKNIMLLCGVTRGGGTARRLCGPLKIDPSAPNLIRVALLCSVPEGQESQDGVWKLATFGEGNWHYLLGVPIREFGSEHWMAQLAKQLVEVEDLGAPRSPYDGDNNTEGCPVTTVGLWGLMAELGADRESKSGTDMSWRTPARAVRYLPCLWKIDSDDGGQQKEDRLDDYDANWLAEAVIRRFCRETGRSSRNSIVVVVPGRLSGSDMKSGVEKVVEAMLHTRRVKAIRVPREDLGDPKAGLAERDRLCAELWRSDAFVVFDETAVSLWTIAHLRQFLARNEHPVAVAGALIDAGWSHRSETVGRFFSLCCWDHIAEVV